MAKLNFPATPTARISEDEFQALIHAAYWAGRADAVSDPNCTNHPKTFSETVARVAAHKAGADIRAELDITSAWEREWRAARAANNSTSA